MSNLNPSHVFLLRWDRGIKLAKFTFASSHAIMFSRGVLPGESLALSFSAGNVKFTR